MQQVWGLTTEHGDYIPLLSDVVVVGRKPVATPDATPLPIPDPTRTLSKTHARLCRDAASDTWAIEDLGSTNGVTMYDETMTQQMSLTPGAIERPAPLLGQHTAELLKEVLGWDEAKTAAFFADK